MLQVLPSYTPEDLLKETGRLLQESKQLRERVADHWQIEPEQWEKSLADSADAVRQYTRWSVTGQAMQQLTGRRTDVNNWKAAKQVRVITDDAFARTLDSARVACIPTPCRRTLHVHAGDVPRFNGQSAATNDKCTNLADRHIHQGGSTSSWAGHADGGDVHGCNQGSKGARGR